MFSVAARQQRRAAATVTADMCMAVSAVADARAALLFACKTCASQRAVCAGGHIRWHITEFLERNQLRCGGGDKRMSTLSSAVYLWLALHASAAMLFIL